jgi:hypothetical protein
MACAAVSFYAPMTSGSNALSVDLVDVLGVSLLHLISSFVTSYSEVIRGKCYIFETLMIHIRARV